MLVKAYKHDFTTEQRSRNQIVLVLVLDASVAKGFVVLQRSQSGKAMLVRIVAMLTKLFERFDPEQVRVRESLSDQSSTSIQERRAFFGCDMNTFFSQKTVKIANFTTASLPVTCYECSWGDDEYRAAVRFRNDSMRRMKDWRGGACFCLA